MFKNLSRKSAAAAFGLLLAAAAVPAWAQFPETGSFAAVLDIAPGTRQCITSPTPAYDNATGEGSVIFGPPVKFTFGSLNGGLLLGDGYPTFYFYRRFERSGVTSFFGPNFPGYFRLCARNEGTEFSTVFLSITTDQ